MAADGLNSIASATASESAVMMTNFESHMHDDVIKWKLFPRYWSFVSEIYRSIPLTQASDVELRCFLHVRQNKKVKEIVDMLVIWDSIRLIVTSL